MRWATCHICNVEEDTLRADNTVVKIHECWSCWKEYCDKHGEDKLRICKTCLDEAYSINKLYIKGDNL